MYIPTVMPILDPSGPFHPDKPKSVRGTRMAETQAGNRKRYGCILAVLRKNVHPPKVSHSI